MKLVIVELDSGERECFESVYHAFKFAKECESKHRHSVEYLLISDGDPETMDDAMEEQIKVIKGQELRYLLRALDDVVKWIKMSRYESEDE